MWCMWCIWCAFGPSILFPFSRCLLHADFCVLLHNSMLCPINGVPPSHHRRTTVAPPSHHPRTTLAPPSHHPRTTLAPSSINGYPGNVLSPGRRGGVGRVAVHDACQAGPGQLGRTATSTSFLTTSSIVSALRSPFPITQHCHTTITVPSHCLLFCTVSLSVVVTIPAVLSPIPPTCTSCVVARARCAFPCFAAPSDSHTRLLLSHSTRLVPMLIVC